METIDAFNGLIGELHTRGVIDRHDKDDLEAESSSTRRNEKLLSMLGRKSKEQFEQFLEALHRTGQPRVVCRLRGIESTPDKEGNICLS